MGRTPIKTSPSPTFSLLMTILETESMDLSSTVAISPSQLLIEAGRTERQYGRDLWRYRELFFFLAWRDLLVRYKQTVVGVSWSIIQPLLTMPILTRP
jgi:homopolymeric O-antigen transport system permease protein